MDAILGGRRDEVDCEVERRWAMDALLGGGLLGGRGLCCLLSRRGGGQWMHCWVGERSGLLGGRAG